MADRTLTAAFLRANRVVFRPHTVGEAIGIQNWMFRHDMRWKDGQKTVWDPQRCVNQLMLVERGLIYVRPDLDVPYTSGKASQLEGWNDDDMLSDSERLEKKVDTLQRQLDDVQGQLARVLSLLEPAVVSKPVVARKATGGHTP